MENPIAEWTSFIVSIVAGVMTLTLWSFFIYLGFRNRNWKEITRALTVLLLFIGWFVIVIIQNRLSAQASMLDDYSTTFLVGYFIFPLTLISLWRVVLLHTSKYLRMMVRIRRYRIMMFGTAIVYGCFYLFASGMITVTSSVPSEMGYFEASQSYGPLTIWPNIEFWFPSIHLFGIASIAGFLMLITLSGIISIGGGLIFYQWQLKKQFDMKAMGSTVGSSLAVTGTCFVSCAFPAIYPLLVFLFGSTAAEPLARLLTDETGFLVNLTQMAVLSVLVTTILFSVQRLKHIDNRLENVYGTNNSLTTHDC